MPIYNKFTNSNLIPPAAECVYTNCYCEENVWHLCEHARQNFPNDTNLNHCFAIFISNSQKMIPLWCQRASTDKENGLVVWDYHVIFLIREDNRTIVYDLDTTLPFPCDFNVYLMGALQSDSDLNPQYHRMFRIIPAMQFLEAFASDRSHMRNDHGQWIKPPPTYPCIQTSISTNNLPDFLDMEPSVGIGEVLTLDQFRMRFQ